MPRAASSDTRIHAIAGSDEATVKRTAADLARQLAPPDGGDFGIDTIDGAAENAAAAASSIHQTLDALLTLPFFGGKLVWLKSANFLADNQLGRSGAVQEALEQLLETLQRGIPDSVTFLMSAIDVDKRRSFYKGLAKLAKVQVFDRVNPSGEGWEEAAADVVESMARERGLRLTPDARELLALLTGGDSATLNHELEKLDLYRGKDTRPIEAGTVRELVALSRAGVIFELGNAIEARDVPRALAMVDQLLEQGESAIGILLVALAPTIRKLLLARDLIETHRLRFPGTPQEFSSQLSRLPADAMAHLPRKKDGSANTWGLCVAATGAKQFSVGELRALMDKCLETNVQLVTSSLDPRVALARVVGLLARAPEGAAA